MLNALSSNWSALLSSAIGNRVGDMLLKSLWWAPVFALLGFVIAIVVIVVLARKRLMVREHRVWNVFAKLSYLVILVGVVFATVTIGVLRHQQNQLDAVMETELLPAMEHNLPTVRTYLFAAIQMHQIRTQVTRQLMVMLLLRDLQYVPLDNGLWEQVKALGINKVLAELRAAASAGPIIGLDDAGSAPAKLVDALPRFVVGKAVDSIDHLFHGMYLSIALLFLGLGALVAGEMLLYFKWYLPRQTRARGA
ncbi:hypothetical protein GTP81_10285 [Rugamonas sp. FT107W]|uniref:Uncharacterized protein n=1 Tax=Duganella vulcania TaxID=2692166 RepID=A0A845HI18_9BURK|nr:hypothetical protein [Duganella vulcania]MYN17139.1 hypothetical protein [Duganella vulcania]